jgi:hypothetical protein
LRSTAQAMLVQLWCSRWPTSCTTGAGVPMTFVELIEHSQAERDPQSPKSALRHLQRTILLPCACHNFPVPSSYLPLQLQAAGQDQDRPHQVPAAAVSPPRRQHACTSRSRQLQGPAVSGAAAAAAALLHIPCPERHPGRAREHTPVQRRGSRGAGGTQPCGLVVCRLLACQQQAGHLKARCLAC